MIILTFVIPKSQAKPVTRLFLNHLVVLGSHLNTVSVSEGIPALLSSDLQREESAPFFLWEPRPLL
jgi:hypothetical protein